MKTKTQTQTVKKLKSLALAGILTMIGVGAAPAQNLVLNGDFTGNAAAFTNWPGVIGAPNPESITNWVWGAGQMGVNGATTGVGDVFGPVNPGGQTYGFIQFQGNMTQTLPAAYTTNAMYQLSFDVAARAGNTDAIFRVRVGGDGTTSHLNTGKLTGNPAGFVHYNYTFTSPATFSGAPTIRLLNATTNGDNTVCFANVSLVALPLPARTNLLADTFDTPDTFDLNDNLATRESGVLAPVPDYISTQDSLADTIEIKNNALVMTRVDNAGSFITRASPDQNFINYEVNNSFQVVCDISAAGAGDCWAAITVRGGSVLQSLFGDCISMYVRPDGGCWVFDGGTSLGGCNLNASTNYHVVIDVNNNIARIFVNDIAVAFNGGQYTYLITNAIHGNYVSFINYASGASTPATARFDNFAISVVSRPVLPATVVLADNFTTADSASLNNDLLTRQSGTAATQTWAAGQLDGAAFAISGNSLSITNTGDTSITSTYGVAFPNLDFAPYERFRSFRFSAQASPVAASGDSWAAVKVRQSSNPVQHLLDGDGFGVFIRPNGTWGVTDGSNVEFTGAVTPVATYLVNIEVVTNIAYVTINGVPVVSGYALSSTQAVNYVSLMSNAGTGSAGVAATFDNFEFDALGTYAGLPSPLLVNASQTSGVASFQFSSVANATYIVEYKNNLTDPAWTALYNVVGTGGTLTVTDTNATTAQRFYHLRVP